MNKIYALTFLNFFVSGGLTLTIPLLLLERKINILEIGVIISVLPLVFLVARLLLAFMADLKGWSTFYLLLNWPASVIATCTYFFAASTFMFLIGKIFEALKDASYWAVNRTAIFASAPNREEKAATRNSAVLLLSTAAGSAVAGIGITVFGFSVTLAIFVAAASAVGFPAALLARKQNCNWRHHSLEIRNLICLRSYGRTFWLVSITLMFFSLAFYPLLNLLAPVFMMQILGFNYLTVGVIYMLFNILASIVIFVALRFQLGRGRVILQSIIAVAASFLLANSNVYFTGLFLALAVAEGLAMGFFESIIAKATKNKVSVSVDIGLLHVPMRIAEFVSLLYASFFVQTVGYMPLFVSCGIFFTIFSALAYFLLRNSHVV
ncbi:MAG: MFS transporter [Candidatus Bathyarchaeia archaeon]